MELVAKPEEVIHKEEPQLIAKHENIIEEGMKGDIAAVETSKPVEIENEPESLLPAPCLNQPHRLLHPWICLPLLLQNNLKGDITQ